MRDYVKFLTGLMVVMLGLLPLIARAQQDNAVPLADPSMAMNLSQISDWSPAHPFINLARTARAWEGHLPGQWGGISNQELRDQGYVDDQGWPIAVPDEARFLASLILVDQPTDQTSVAGRYRVTYSGDAKVNLSLAARVIRRAENEIWFEFPTGATGPVMIEVSDMDPANPLRDLAIVHERNIPAYELGAQFNPDFVRRIRDFRVLRFMNWMRTNGSTVRTWQELPEIGDYTYSGGVPLQVMVDLANLVGADPWFTLPHLSDDDLIRRYAQSVKDRLDPDLKAYVEFSNELWNFGFAQAKWAQAQAQERWGRRAGGEGWLEFAGLRAAQVAMIFSDVFGAEADDRLTNVIAVQAASPGRSRAQLEGRNLIDELGGSAAQYFDAYALTGYLWLSMDSGQTAPTVRRWMAQGDEDFVFDQLAANLRAGALRAQISAYWPEHYSFANANGLEMIMYEGGTHVIQPYDEPRDDEVIALLNRFNYSPQMDALYLELLDGWARAGGKLFNPYLAFYTPGRHGAWGHLRHLDDQTGRWDILLAHNRRPSKLNETREPDAFKQGRIVTGGSGDIIGTAFDDILTGGDGDDLFVPKSGRDLVHGGNGVDQLMLDGTMARISFKVDGDLITARNGDSQVTFKGIEYLLFAGDNFALATSDIPGAR